MKIALIAAMTKHKIIGTNYNLPWNIPAELKYFRQITLHKPIIMGSNTFRSIKRPLNNRYNIVLTSKTTELTAEFKDKVLLSPYVNLTFVSNLETSLFHAKNFYRQHKLSSEEQEIMIIGGKKIYEQFLPLADRMYLSIIKQSYPGNVTFPEYDLEQWHMIDQTEYPEFTTQIFDKKSSL